ncbi:hypothetical protein WJX73_001284 [Symbiochloris irregularis]|uniref:BTB domain-containing protein n=1 Tax=Symbiochloris irregularis TaxID=706552 RepID=A0AAW1NRJ9_9CHLO
MAAAKAEHQELVQQGVEHIVTALLADLGSQDQVRQSQALQALDGLTKRSSADGKGSLAAVQRTFCDGAGFPKLVAVLDAARPASPGAGAAEPDGASKLAAKQAVTALQALTRNSAESRHAAVLAGAVPALCTALGEGSKDAPPLCLAVITVLHTLIASDDSGHSTSELFAAGGIHVVVRLLAWALQSGGMEEVEREDWCREIVALLLPLTKRSHVISRALAENLSTLAHLLTTSHDPLTLSVGLDILEEMLARSDGRHAAALMAREGILAALVQLLHVKGLGSKAVLVLTALSAEKTILGGLRALLRPLDLAAITQITLAAARADDLDGAAPRQLLGALVRGDESACVLAGLTQARCLGPCLALPSLRPFIIDAALSDCGVTVLHNMPAACRGEAAMAAAHLLRHLPDYAPLLLQPHVLPSLVDALLAQAKHSNGHTEAVDAIEAIHSALEEHSFRATEAIPVQPPASPAGVSLVENGNKRSMRQMPSGLVRDRMQALARSHSSVPPASPSQGSSPTVTQSLEGPIPEGAPMSQDSRSFATVTFSVAGKELYALAWVVEAASPAIARTLAGIEDVDSIVIAVPDVPTVPSEALYGLFAQALEFAYTGELKVDADGVLLLWPLAAALQMEQLQEQCEALLQGVMGRSDHMLATALRLAELHGSTGRDLVLTQQLSALRVSRANQAVHRQMSSAPFALPRVGSLLAGDFLSKLSFDAWTDVDSGRFRRSNSVRSGSATPTSPHRAGSFAMPDAPHRLGSFSVPDAESTPASPLQKDFGSVGWQENGHGKALPGRVSRPSRLSVTADLE